ncbi:MAG: alpha/beta fold hydrolase [Pseudomonadota bacterium]
MSALSNLPGRHRPRSMRYVLSILIPALVMYSFGRSASSETSAAIATDPMFPPSMAELSIPANGDRMAALIYLAEGIGPHPTLILAHGLPGNEKNLDVAQAVRRAGYNTLFFHYRGAWGSEGGFKLSSMPDDIASVVRFLRDNATRYRVDTQHISLLGHSMGGYAVIAAGAADSGLHCIGALAPANLGLIAEGLRSNQDWANAFVRYSDTLFMLRDYDGNAMRDDLLSQSATRLDTRGFAPKYSGRSILLITGESDTVLPPQTMFEPTVAAFRRNRTIALTALTIPGDHSFSYSRLLLTEHILDWLNSDCR